MPSRRIFVLLAFLFGCLLYGLTAAPGVLWQDSAMFQFRVWHGDLLGELGLALAHPLYILLARAFAWLPLASDFAARVNLFSAFCGAACLALAMDLLLTITQSRLAAACGTLLLAVSHTFWTHAVIAEVYNLYALGLLIELWLLERFCRIHRPGWLLLAIFVNGLNISNHLLALLHAPAYGWVLWVALRRRWLHASHLVVLAPAFLAGLSPYLWIIVGEIQKERPVVDVLKESLLGPPGRGAGAISLSFPLVKQALKSAQCFAMNFPTPLALMAPVGFWMACRRRELRWFAAVGGLIFAVNFVFAFRYQVVDQFAFFTGCYVCFALFVAVGIKRLTEAPASREGTEPPHSEPRPGGATPAVVLVALALLPAGLYEALPAAARRWKLVSFNREIPYRDSFRYFLLPRKNGDTSAGRFAREALATAAPDGLLVTGYDSTVKDTLVFMRDVESVERGVTLNYGADTTPAPPAIHLTPDAVRPYVQAGQAWVTTNLRAYMQPWLWEEFEREADGVVWRMREKK